MPRHFPHISTSIFYPLGVSFLIHFFLGRVFLVDLPQLGRLCELQTVILATAVHVALKGWPSVNTVLMCERRFVESLTVNHCLTESSSGTTTSRRFNHGHRSGLNFSHFLDTFRTQAQILKLSSLKMTFTMMLEITFFKFLSGIIWSWCGFVLAPLVYV